MKRLKKNVFTKKIELKFKLEIQIIGVKFSPFTPKGNIGKYIFIHQSYKKTANLVLASITLPMKKRTSPQGNTQKKL